MDEAYLEQALTHLAARGCMDQWVDVRTVDLADALGVSQQSASRRLIALARSGHIDRRSSHAGTRIVLLELGRSVVEAVHRRIDPWMRPDGPVALMGRVASGLGEGSYYLSRPGYMSQFRELLGWTPFPGTLNVPLDEPSSRAFQRLLRAPGLTVLGFTDEGRTFGGARLFLATLGELEAAIVVPNRTHHENVAEVLAPMSLRERLGLKDGTTVRLMAWSSQEAA